MRRNLKVEDEDTNINTPNKSKEEQSLQNNQLIPKKIYLPMLIAEFDKKADLEIIMNEDQNKAYIFSDTHCNLYNDNHVLLKAGLLNENEQGNIDDLYETEVKPTRKSLNISVNKF